MGPPEKLLSNSQFHQGKWISSNVAGSFKSTERGEAVGRHRGRGCAERGDSTRLI
jgi:hypothetical protein